MIEAGHGHAHWLGVSSYDKNAKGFVSTHSARYTGGATEGQKYRQEQRCAVFGQHPQQAWRKISKDHIIVKGARGPQAVRDSITGEMLRFSDDFEAMLTQKMTLGDFTEATRHGNGDGAARQLPPDVIQDIQRALDAGAVPTGRTALLVAHLIAEGRLHP